jgi:predicted ATPase
MQWMDDTSLEILQHILNIEKDYQDD